MTEQKAAGVVYWVDSSWEVHKVIRSIGEGNGGWVIAEYTRKEYAEAISGMMNLAQHFEV